MDRPFSKSKRETCHVPLVKKIKTLPKNDLMKGVILSREDLE